MNNTINLIEIATINIGSNAYFVRTNNEIEVVSEASYGGLKFYNITIPSEPQEISTFKFGAGGPHNIVIQDDLLFLADYSDGLEIVDISDPTKPTHLSTVDTGGYAVGLHVIDSLVYVTDYNTGLKVINATNPSSPEVIGSFEGTNFASVSIAKNNNIAVVAAYQSKVFILDISDPRNVTMITSYSISSGVEVTTLNDVAYIAAWERGLEIVNISDANNPKRLFSYPTDDICGSLYIDNDLLYITRWHHTIEDFNGFEILNISNPSEPVQLSNYSNTKQTKNVYSKNDLIFVADGKNGLVILQYDFNNGKSSSKDSVHGFDHFLGILGVFSLVIRVKKRRLMKEKFT